MILVAQILLSHAVAGDRDMWESWVFLAYMIGLALLFSWLWSRRERTIDREFHKDDEHGDHSSRLALTRWVPPRVAPPATQAPVLSIPPGSCALAAADPATGWFLPEEHGHPPRVRVFTDPTMASLCALNRLVDEPDVEWILFDDQGKEMGAFRNG